MDDESVEQYEWSAVSVQAAAGVELRLVRRLYLTGGYKLTRVAPEVTIVRGTARTSLVTQHVVFGIALHLDRDRAGGIAQ